MLQVKKLLIESRPGFFISSALYIPKPAPSHAPGVVFTSGHTTSAFRSNASDDDDYQIVQLNLVFGRGRGLLVKALSPLPPPPAARRGKNASKCALCRANQGPALLLAAGGSRLRCACH